MRQSCSHCNNRSMHQFRNCNQIDRNTLKKST